MLKRTYFVILFIFSLFLTACNSKVGQDNDTGNGSDTQQTAENNMETKKEADSRLSYDGVYPEHEPYGSGIGSSAENLQGLCSAQTNWTEGRRFEADTSPETIKEWLETYD